MKTEEPIDHWRMRNAPPISAERARELRSSSTPLGPADSYSLRRFDVIETFEARGDLRGLTPDCRLCLLWGYARDSECGPNHMRRFWKSALGYDAYVTTKPIDLESTN